MGLQGSGGGVIRRVRWVAKGAVVRRVVARVMKRCSSPAWVAGGLWIGSGGKVCVGIEVRGIHDASARSAAGVQLWPGRGFCALASGAVRKGPLRGACVGGWVELLLQGA